MATQLEFIYTYRYTYTYVYIIYTPKLGIGDYSFRSGKGAGPLSEGASREQGRAGREHEGALREH
jgi:hypothetical protein